MIAASPETTRSRIVSAAAHLSPSLDDRHQTESSRYFLPTENPEGPCQKGKFGVAEAQLCMLGGRSRRYLPGARHTAEGNITESRK